MTPVPANSRQSERKLYDAIGGPLYAVHFNGNTYAAFCSPNEALAYWNGLDARGRTYMHIEDADGNLVTGFRGSLGHASAILDALDKRAPDESQRHESDKESEAR